MSEYNKEIIKRKANEIYGGDSIFNERRIGFIEGAEWILNNKWINVEDELPKDGEIVLGMFENGNFILCCVDNNSWWAFEGVATYNKCEMKYCLIVRTVGIKCWMSIHLPNMQK